MSMNSYIHQTFLHSNAELIGKGRKSIIQMQNWKKNGILDADDWK